MAAANTGASRVRQAEVCCGRRDEVALLFCCCCGAEFEADGEAEERRCVKGQPEERGENT